MLPRMITSIDCGFISKENILNFPEYLMRKHNIKFYLGFSN